jgi:two-component system alkaline phosphatase synthesis response regulator PhoP
MAKILLIEDEAGVRLIVRVNLELAGLEVLEAADGVAGLAQARAERPDLILLDAMLPNLDGWQVAEELLHDPSTCAIPIIFLSAHADSTTRERALELGATDYVTKPFDPPALARAIDEILSARRAADGRGTAP